MESINYCAFISYRHESPDQEIAKALHTAIETFGIPGSVKKKTGIRKMGKVFRDQEELPLSSDLSADIETALDNSEWFIAICSPRYLQSCWCLREMEYFIEHKGRDRVLTILVEGEPEDSFPEMIRFYEDENGKRVESEPLAADIRSDSMAGSLKMVRNEKLRILAPMLGIMYDDLKRRARQRKIRIASIIGAAAFAAVLAATVFLVLNHKRQKQLEFEALEQQRIAEEEKQRAEQERIQAIYNNIGESLQKAGSLRADMDRRQSASVLLDALSLSDENDGIRRDEIITELRNTMYIEPFSIISKLDLQNARLNNAQISPDGTKAICIANGNSVVMIDLTASQVVYAVSKDNSEITYIAFSPDGSRFVALCDYYRYATVWNTEEGSEVFTYYSDEDRQNMVVNAAFWQGSDNLLVQDYDRFWLVSLTDGGKTLFYTMGEQQDGYDYNSNLYTFGLGKSIDELITESSDDYAHSTMKISPDGSMVLISGRDGSTGTILLDTNGKRIALLDKLPGTIMEYYDISPDGQYVSCQSILGFLGVWETGTGRMRYLKSLDRGFANNITAPVFSPDSQKLAYISEGTLTVADAAKGKELAVTDLEWAKEVPPVLSWSQDNEFLFFFNPNLYFTDAQTGGVIVFRAADVDNMFNNAVPVGDDLVFVTRGGGEAVCYSLPGISSIVFQEDYDGDIAGVDPLDAAGGAWTEPPRGEHIITETFRTLNNLTDDTPGVYYTQDGNYAALVYADGTIEVFRKDTPDKVALMNAQFTYAPAAFALTDSYLVAADSNGRVMFQNLNNESMKILETGAAHTAFVYLDKLLMAAQDNGQFIDVFDIEKAQLLFSMRSSVPFVSMCFSADGEYALAYTEDECMTAHLWTEETALLEQARRLAPGH